MPWSRQMPTQYPSNAASNTAWSVAVATSECCSTHQSRDKQEPSSSSGAPKNIYSLERWLRQERSEEPGPGSWERDDPRSLKSRGAQPMTCSSREGPGSDPCTKNDNRSDHRL